MITTELQAPEMGQAHTGTYRLAGLNLYERANPPITWDSGVAAQHIKNKL